MKKLRKILCLFLSMLMIVSINVPAFAVNSADRVVSANEETHNNEKPLSIAISTNKEKYKTLGVAKITATITNTSDEDIQNVSAEAVFSDLAPVGKKTDIKKEVETLKSGESISFTYKATLNKNEHKLNIFQKIFLWLVRLFNGGFTASDNGFDNGREYVALTNSLTFGEFSADNEVRVWYGENEDKPPVKPDTQDKTYEELIEDVDIDEMYDYDESDISVDDEQGVTYINNIIVISFDWDCTDKRKAEIVNSINGKVVGGVSGYNELHVEVKKSTLDEIKQICSYLEKLDGVSYAKYDALWDMTFNSEQIYPTSKSYIIPNDPWFGAVWDEYNFNMTSPNWWILATETHRAWGYEQYFHDVNIGVVDGGFDSLHEDLNIQIVSQGNSADAHGMHVAGIIGATANNNKGITGIAQHSTLFGYSVGASGMMSETEMYNGLEVLVEKYKCKVVNFSLGKKLYEYNGKYYLDEQACDEVTESMLNSWGECASEKIGKLLEKGYDFVIVQSAGNGAKNTDLGINAINNGCFASISKNNCYSSKKVSTDKIINRVIVVGNAYKDGDSYIFNKSSNGNNIDIAAPGTDIASTILSNEYGVTSGTSAASPIVAGVASLVWSVNPNFNGAQVKKIVQDTAEQGGTKVEDNMDSPTSGSSYLVNAKLAVEEAIQKTYWTGTVSGKVVDILPNEPKPLSKINISAIEKNTNKTIYGKTEVDGTFSIVLPIGTYDIKFSKGLADLVVEDVLVSYNSFSDLGILEMMIPLCQVSGVVKDKSSNFPLSGVTVGVRDIYLPVSNRIEVTTDEDGRFKIEFSCSDDCIFYFSCDGYESYGQQVDCSDTVVDLGDILLCPYGSGDEDNRKVIDSGNCGENGDELQWTLYDDGELVISGTGKMSNYSAGKAPWYGYRDEIKTVTVKDGITTISNNAFYDLTALQKVNIANSLTEIGNDVFSNCSSLASVDLGNSLQKMGCLVFKDCYNLKTVTLPATIAYSVSYWTTSTLYSNEEYDTYDKFHGSYNHIGTFGGSYVETVIIADGATTVPSHIFSGAMCLKHVSIPDSVTLIDNYAFYNCKSIVNVKMPANLSVIGNYAFYNCKNITDVKMPANLSGIGQCAFSDCTSITSIDLGNSLQVLGPMAFKDCFNLKALSLPATLEISSLETSASLYQNKNYDYDIYDKFHGSYSDVGALGGSYIETVTIADGATNVPANLFSGAMCLKTVNIPNSVVNIGRYAFNNCRSIEALAMPENLIKIDDYAFRNCTSLANIDLGNRLQKMGYATFLDCYELKKLIIPASINYSNSIYDDGISSTRGKVYLYTNPNYETYDKFYGKYGNIGALGGSYIEKVVISDGATIVPSNIFSGDVCLKEIIIPNSIKRIGSYAFYNCKQLSNVKLNHGLQYIGEFAFDCTAIEKITIPNTIIDMGYTHGAAYTTDDSCFGYLNSIKEVIFEDGIKSIPRSACRGCHLLNNVVIPESVITIEVRAFCGCNNLQNITIPESVTNIEPEAFSDCYNLRNITIPESVANIGAEAFEHCRSLEKITVNNPNCIIADSENTISDTATIYGYGGSTAEAYAQKYNRKFVEIVILN